MSYKCDICEEVVFEKVNKFVDVQRIVQYMGMKTFFVGRQKEPQRKCLKTTTGKETVVELNLCSACAEQKNSEPTILESIKIVEYEMPKRPKPVEPNNNSNDDDERD